MRKFLTTAVLALVATASAWAQKTMYVPQEWRNRTDTLIYAESDPDNKYTWSKSRSIESDNVIVLWDKGYGSTLPSEAPSAYRVDQEDLLRKCEAFYDLEINKLGFVNPETSSLSKYKVMVLMNHTTDWVCYGGGYDYWVSALWLSPSTCKPVGHSVAHEVGHSFHYMCYAEASGHKESSTVGTGFHLPVGNGQTIWEQTAQWQAAQSYPSLMFDQSISVFRKSHNMAFTHEWHRYQSYWLHYYLCDRYDDLTTVAQVWNQPMTGACDFNESLMKLKGLSAVDLYRLYYDYAAHCATWDMSACASYGQPYIGDFDYRCVLTADSTYQVALASAPHSTGFNIIPLQVPEAGTPITTQFVALSGRTKLAAGDPAELMNGETQWAKSNLTQYVSNSNALYRGWRLGYVALMQDGTRRYFQQDSVYCTSSGTTKNDTCEVSMTVPEGVSRLWLVASPAPRRYVQHKWDEKNTVGEEMWPYSFHLTGTDLTPHAIVYSAPVLDGREVADVALTYDVWFPASSSVYPGTTVTVAGKALAQIGTAFQIEPSTISSLMQTYSASGPSAGKIMFYPLNPTTQATVARASTANGYGHWFGKSGAVSDYGSGYVYSELDASSLTFTIGQYPGRTKNGEDYTIGQALRYKTTGGKEALCRFIFRIHFDASRTGNELATVVYNDPTQGITPLLATPDAAAPQGLYNLGGQRISIPQRHGIYVENGHLKAY